MNCQLCGCQAPTKHVTFRQNIGALVMRFHKKLEGDFCKSCINQNFWKMTLTTLAVGWLGMISLVVAPIFIIANIVQYLGCLGLPSASATPALVPAAPAAPRAATNLPPAAPQASAVAEELTNESIEALNPSVEQIASRLNAGEDMNKVAADIARITGVAPAQVTLYIHALIQSSSQQS